MTYTPEQVEEYLAHVQKVSADKYTPEQFKQYAEHVRATSLSDEKPAITSVLPKALQSFFPSDKESVKLRTEQGLPAVPPEPKSEYTPAEEMMLGSIVAPASIPKALGAARAVATSPLIPKAAGLATEAAGSGLKLMAKWGPLGYMLGQVGGRLIPKKR